MELPTASSGSGVINLSLLAPGVGTSGGIGAGTGPSVGGQRPRNNNFTVEGIDNNSGSVTGPLVTVPNDAVAEFTFLKNQFCSDFGHSSGGQFNQVVKSGTNDFHGSAYEYLFNRNLDAADNLNFVRGHSTASAVRQQPLRRHLRRPNQEKQTVLFCQLRVQPDWGVGHGTVCAPTSAGYNTLAGIPASTRPT